MSPTDEMVKPVIEVKDLSVTYRTGRGPVQAVHNVSIDVLEGETLGIVGESGCGKSSLARAILQLPRPTEGEVIYGDRDLASLSPRQLRSIRPELQMVFQEPISSLNPRRTIRQSVAEPLKLRGGLSRSERTERVDEMLTAVGLEPSMHGAMRPTQLSGGQCQRASIARALLSGARLLVCDEAVSALDVSLRATVLNLINRMKDEFSFSVIFIGHDLAVVKNVSDRIAVMYLGTVCEVASADALYERPLHPYTDALLAVIPEPDPDHPLPGRVLSGELPSPLNPPSGCRFRTRCPRATSICEQEPELRFIGPNRQVACHHPLEYDEQSPEMQVVESANKSAVTSGVSL